MNTFVNKEGKAILIPQKSVFTSQLQSDLQHNNKKIYCSTTSKQYGEDVKATLSRSCPGKTIKLLSGDDGDEEKREISRNVNENWTADLLMTTPVNTVGMNFTEEHFDLKYVYATKSSCAPATLAQMCGRVRSTRESTLYFHVNDKKNFFSVGTLQEVEALWEFKHQSLVRQKNQFGITGDWQIAPKWLKDLCLHSDLESNLSKQYYSEILSKYFENLGYEVIKEDWEETRSNKNKMVVTTTKYGDDDVLTMSEKEKQCLLARIYNSKASEEDKMKYKKLCFHKYVKNEGSFKDVFEHIWMNTWKREALQRLSVFNGQTPLKKMIEDDCSSGRSSINSNDEILFQRDIRWLCQKLNLDHPHDTKTMIPRQTIVDLYKREGEKLESMAKIFKVGTIGEKREKLEGIAERTIDFLNRILTKYCLSTLNVAKERKRTMINGKKVEDTPFQINTKIPFYILLKTTCN
jgi:hypothetical protein